MPFQGHAMLDVSLLSAILNGKLNRLLSLDLSANDMKRAVECELQIWLLHGYPLQTILHIWRRGKRFPAAITHGRKYWNTLFETVDRPRVFQCHAEIVAL